MIAGTTDTTAVEPARAVNPTSTKKIEKDKWSK